MTFSTPQKIQVQYDASQVQNMINMLKAAPFPTQAPVDAKEPWSLGIDFEYLKKLKSTMETTWKWETLEAKINKYDNYLVDYENGDDKLQLHFVHAKSQRQDAIPLILMHGWPGTFYDFHKIIESLINPPSANIPAFHVVVPSIPGYFQSTLPRRHSWNPIDIATLYHGLMMEVLGYQRYVGQGGDWGSSILHIMSASFEDNLLASHFNAFGGPSPPPDAKLSTIEAQVIALREEFEKTGMAYSEMQSTKPFTIGLAIGSSPLAVLAYIGEKIYTWSDPELVDLNAILDTVALYFLSGSFATSVMIYNQAIRVDSEIMNPADSEKWKVKTKFGYSSFMYENGGCHKEGIEESGTLDFYKEHEQGGHFPALENPAEFVEDLREFFGQAYYG